MSCFWANIDPADMDLVDTHTHTLLLKWQGIVSSGRDGAGCHVHGL